MAKHKRHEAAKPAPHDAAPGIGFAEIKAELIRRIEQLARSLAPGGHAAGGYYIALNPTRDDRHAGSFWIRVSGQAIGAWKDEATGAQGDVVSLVTYCARLAEDRPGRLTREWCLDWLGWGRSVDRKTLEIKAKADRYVREQDDRMGREELEQKRRSAKAWWLKADRDIVGTVVATYLAGRGIDLSRLAQPPRALRFIPRLDHTDPATGEITTWPGMMAAMTDAQGRIVAVHRTFLAPDGSGKAPIAAPKKIWPHGYQGAVIRLAKGASDLTPEDAARAGVAGPLLLTEGVENALTCALARPDLRIWACATLGNLGHVPVNHPCVSRVIIFADNDAAPETRARFDKAVKVLSERRPVAVTHAQGAKDANDLLRGKFTCSPK